MLNLKGLVIDKSDSGEAWVQLVANKSGKVTAADIKTSSDITVINPDLYITEIDQDGFELAIDIRIEKSTGYVSIEQLKEKEDDVNVLLVDANFSPVLNISYEIEDVRFGDMTDLDEIQLTVKTNGIISPIESIRFAGNMLTSYFSM